MLGKLIIFFIRIYQKTPGKRHGFCVFEPTCSQYMILAIQKYGTIAGVKKGIDRLKRCKFPNGCVDYP